MANTSPTAGAAAAQVAPHLLPPRQWPLTCCAGVASVIGTFAAATTAPEGAASGAEHDAS